MRGFGGLADNFMFNTMTADVCDDDELRSGLRYGQGRTDGLGRGYRVENEVRPNRISGGRASSRHLRHVVLPDHPGKGGRDPA